MAKQIKSKQRVAEHGEVFTAEREVNAMLDLVKPECLRPDSRFLEPACGDGNFLSAILERKLKEIRRKYKSSVRDYEYYSVIAIGSLYGVDIMQDNVEICRQRLFKIWESHITLDRARFLAEKIYQIDYVNPYDGKYKSVLLHTREEPEFTEILDIITKNC